MRLTFKQFFLENRALSALSQMNSIIENTTNEENNAANKYGKNVGNAFEYFLVDQFKKYIKTKHYKIFTSTPVKKLTFRHQ